MELVNQLLHLKITLLSLSISTQKRKTFCEKIFENKVEASLSKTLLALFAISEAWVRSVGNRGENIENKSAESNFYVTSFSRLAAHTFAYTKGLCVKR